MPKQKHTITTLIHQLDEIAARAEVVDPADVAAALRDIIELAGEELAPVQVRDNHVKVDEGHARWLEDYLSSKGTWVSTQHLLEVTKWDVRYLRAAASEIDAISSSEHGGYIAFDLAPPANIERYVMTQNARADGNYDRAKRMQRRLAQRLVIQP